VQRGVDDLVKFVHMMMIFGVDIAHVGTVVGIHPCFLWTFFTQLDKVNQGGEGWGRCDRWNLGPLAG